MKETYNAEKKHLLYAVVIGLPIEHTQSREEFLTKFTKIHCANYEYKL